MSEVTGGAREEQPHIQGAVAARAQEGREELLTFKVRRGNLVQSKEQWLHFAGAAVKRYPTSKVRDPNKTVCVARGIRGQTHKP